MKRDDTRLAWSWAYRVGLDWMRERGSCLSAQWAQSGSMGKTVSPAGREVITRTRERARGSATTALEPDSTVCGVVVVGHAVGPVFVIGAAVVGGNGGAGDEDEKSAEGEEDAITH